MLCFVLCPNTDQSFSFDNIYIATQWINTHNVWGWSPTIFVLESPPGSTFSLSSPSFPHLPRLSSFSLCSKTFVKSGLMRTGKCRITSCFSLITWLFREMRLAAVPDGQVLPLLSQHGPALFTSASSNTQVWRLPCAQVRLHLFLCCLYLPQKSPASSAPEMQAATLIYNFILTGEKA